VIFAGSKLFDCARLCAIGGEVFQQATVMLVNRKAQGEEKDVRKKRDLFDELVEGFDALADQRAGKRTLHTHVVKAIPEWMQGPGRE